MLLASYMSREKITKSELAESNNLSRLYNIVISCLKFLPVHEKKQLKLEEQIAKFYEDLGSKINWNKIEESEIRKTLNGIFNSFGGRESLVNINYIEPKDTELYNKFQDKEFTVISLNLAANTYFQSPSNKQENYINYWRKYLQEKFQQGVYFIALQDVPTEVLEVLRDYTFIAYENIIGNNSVNNSLFINPNLGYSINELKNSLVIEPENHQHISNKEETINGRIGLKLDKYNVYSMYLSWLSTHRQRNNSWKKFSEVEPDKIDITVGDGNPRNSLQDFVRRNISGNDSYSELSSAFLAIDMFINTGGRNSSIDRSLDNIYVNKLHNYTKIPFTNNGLTLTPISELQEFQNSGGKIKFPDSSTFNISKFGGIIQSNPNTWVMDFALTENNFEVQVDNSNENLNTFTDHYPTTYTLSEEEKSYRRIKDA